MLSRQDLEQEAEAESTEAHFRHFCPALVSRQTDSVLPSHHGIPVRLSCRDLHLLGHFVVWLPDGHYTPYRVQIGVLDTGRLRIARQLRIYKTVSSKHGLCMITHLENHSFSRIALLALIRHEAAR